MVKYLILFLFISFQSISQIDIIDKHTNTIDQENRLIERGVYIPVVNDDGEELYNIEVTKYYDQETFEVKKIIIKTKITYIKEERVYYILYGKIIKINQKMEFFERGINGYDLKSSNYEIYIIPDIEKYHIKKNGKLVEVSTFEKMVIVTNSINQLEFYLQFFK
jgi:hypothetical protein